ncbi:MAG TPA: hypothetical protein VIX87_10595 [Steroidobacteraceae bacterium]
MTELHRALSEINAIRGQIARGAQFRGYGPATLSATGVLAVLAAAAQAYWVSSPERDMTTYLSIWVATAVLSLAVIGIETVTRTRRVHVGLARHMIHAAFEQFLPPIVAGLLLTAVLWRCAPGNLWMLPGLWQIVFGLGVFASCRFLPRPMFVVGLWYLSAGLMCLALGPQRALSPWAMGAPFGVGQLLVAGVLQLDYYRQADE